MGWNYLSIPKLQRCSRWSLGMDKWFHPTLYNGCNYLSILCLKLNHVSKRNPRCPGKVMTAKLSMFPFGKINNHWFRQWLVAWSAPSHYLNQCWHILNWNLRNKLQWNLNRNPFIFIQENAFENVVWKMAAICLSLNVLMISNTIVSFADQTIYLKMVDEILQAILVNRSASSFHVDHRHTI